LIALMKDQVDALAQLGVRASYLNSTLDSGMQRFVEQQLLNGELDLLYVAPERVMTANFASLLKQTQVALFAIDEAHCVSQWGHDFRPEYIQLGSLVEQFPDVPRIALTATADAMTRQEMVEKLRLEQANQYISSFDRPNISYNIVSKNNAKKQLLDFYTEHHQGDSGIVYCLSRKSVEQTALWLEQRGINALPYHAGLPTEVRQKHQEMFLKDESIVMVATVAFGMGIDKADIRAVYHYNLPKSLENYSQEIGRAGRDGEPSLCHMLACSEDLIPLQNFIYGDTPTVVALNKFVSEIFSHRGEFDIALYELSNQCDIRPLVLRTLLTRLELDGYLKGGTPFYANYQFKPLMSSEEILSRFEGERRQFIAGIFRQATKSRIWFQIDLQAASDALESPRQRLVTALDYLGEQSMLEVKVAGVRNRYTVLKTPQSTESLAQELSDDAVDREAREIHRLQEVVSWISLAQCQTSALCERFDQALEKDCGHCGYCESKTAVELKALKKNSVPDNIIADARALQSEKPQLLATATDLARVLCGLSSPAISKARLAKHELFGSCAEISFATVLSQLKDSEA